MVRTSTDGSSSEPALAFPARMLALLRAHVSRLTTQRTASRASELCALLTLEPHAHLSDIYEALEKDREAFWKNDPEARGTDPIPALTELSDRFALGTIGAEEYDRSLRRALGLPGQGRPIR